MTFLRVLAHLAPAALLPTAVTVWYLTRGRGATDTKGRP